MSLCLRGKSSFMQQKPNYGLDAPPVVRNFLVLGAVTFVAAIGLWLANVSRWTGIQLSGSAFVLGLFFWLNAVVMVMYSKVGKLRARERLLNLIPWHGDEQVLDVGCGRGLLLIAAAKRLTRGKAVGVDLRQQEDLSNNGPEAALENAHLEGVADRVEVHNGDARQLPFANESFDSIVSSLAIHNIYDGPQREQAIHEIVRVLRPGGWVAISDIQHTAQYADIFRHLGMGDVNRTPLGWWTLLVAIFTWGSVRPFRVIARKSASAAVV